MEIPFVKKRAPKRIRALFLFKLAFYNLIRYLHLSLWRGVYKKLFKHPMISTPSRSIRNLGSQKLLDSIDLCIHVIDIMEHHGLQSHRSFGRSQWYWPWWLSRRCFRSVERSFGKSGICRILSSTLSIPMMMWPRSLPHRSNQRIESKKVRQSYPCHGGSFPWSRDRRPIHCNGWRFLKPVGCWRVCSKRPPK